MIDGETYANREYSNKDTTYYWWKKNQIKLKTIEFGIFDKYWTTELMHIPLDGELPLKIVTGPDKVNSLISCANCRIWSKEHRNIKRFTITFLHR